MGPGEYQGYRCVPPSPLGSLSRTKYRYKSLCRLVVWNDAPINNAVTHFEHKLETVGFETEPGVFKKGEEGVEAIRKLSVHFTVQLSCQHLTSVTCLKVLA